MTLQVVVKVKPVEPGLMRTTVHDKTMRTLSLYSRKGDSIRLAVRPNLGLGVFSVRRTGSTVTTEFHSESVI